MKTKLLFSLSAALLLQQPGAYAASAGNAAGQVLKIGAGARQAALGDTGTALGGDSLSVFWNPAGLGAVDRCSVSASHSRWFEEVGYSVVSAACPTKNSGVFAAGWQFLGYGSMDSLDNTGAKDGKLNPSERVLSASWGLASADKSLAFGATAKQFSMTIDRSASALAADFGLLKTYPGFSLGAAVKNAGQKIKFNRASENLPQLVKLGARAVLGRAALLADLSSSKDGSWLSGGAEYTLVPGHDAAPVALRAGYSTRAKAKGVNFTAGCGITEESWLLDYAFAPYGDLGVTHHLSVSYLFAGPGAAKKKAAPRARPFDNERGAPSDRMILLPAEKIPDGWTAP